MNLGQCSCPCTGGVCPYQVPARAWSLAEAWEPKPLPKRIETLARLIEPLGPDDYRLPAAGSMLRALYEFLKGHGPAHNHDIAVAMGWPQSMVASRLCVLRKRRLVASRGKPQRLIFRPLKAK